MLHHNLVHECWSLTTSQAHDEPQKVQKTRHVGLVSIAIFGACAGLNHADVLRRVDVR